MKNIFTSIALVFSIAAFAQQADSVQTPGGNFEIYYDFETQSKYSISSSAWDIGLTTDMRDASILINENAGVELYLYSTDTSQWSTLDTTGFAFDNIYNSEDNWAEGAFANQGTRHPDYGWGIYNMNSHDINGNRLFILKNREGAYLKVVVDKMSSRGDFTIRTANLDGSNAQTHSYSKMNPITKDRNFALLDIASNGVTAENPNTGDWDVKFTRYVTTVMQGPISQDMAVSGLKVNKGYEVAERAGVDVTSNDTSALSWSTSITEIGYDWKSFDRGTFQYNMTPDLTYFVRTTNGAIWKIYFTNYQGGAVGQSNFTIEEIKAGVTSASNTIAANTTIYPNPVRDVLNINNEEAINLDIVLTDIQGTTVANSVVQAFGTATINTSDLTSGIYFLEMKSETASYTKRVLVD
jgi:hypothetical protein